MYSDKDMSRRFGSFVCERRNFFRQMNDLYVKQKSNNICALRVERSHCIEIDNKSIHPVEKSEARLVQRREKDSLWSGRCVIVMWCVGGGGWVGKLCVFEAMCVEVGLVVCGREGV